MMLGNYRLVSLIFTFTIEHMHVKTTSLVCTRLNASLLQTRDDKSPVLSSSLDLMTSCYDILNPAKTVR